MKAIRVWRNTCHTERMRDKCEPELIAACKRGDEAAYTELFEQHYPSSLRVARGILRSEEESRDAVQSAYLSAFRHLHKFRGDAAFKTWITRIVTNHCLMQLRQPGFRINWINLDDLTDKGGSSLLASTAPTPEKSTFCREISSALSDAAARLPKRLLEVFDLYAVSGLSIKEVAAVTGLTVSAAKSRLFRAQARMRVHLQPVWSNAQMRRGVARRGKRNERGCQVWGKAA
jgi:RNA polymerase sigma-70 factor (ECF subfamily)